MDYENYCKDCKHYLNGFCEIAKTQAIKPVQLICKSAGWKEVGGRHATDSKSTGDWATYLEENR